MAKFRVWVEIKSKVQAKDRTWAEVKVEVGARPKSNPMSRSKFELRLGSKLRLRLRKQFLMIHV